MQPKQSPPVRGNTAGPDFKVRELRESCVAKRDGAPWGKAIPDRRP